MILFFPTVQSYTAFLNLLNQKINLVIGKEKSHKGNNKAEDNTFQS